MSRFSINMSEPPREPQRVRIPMDETEWKDWLDRAEKDAKKVLEGIAHLRAQAPPQVHSQGSDELWSFLGGIRNLCTFEREVFRNYKAT